jgi:hypothetical protein
MRSLPYFFLITDIGFVLYWLLTFFNFIPLHYAFKDYENPILVAWNWSFFPLDILISITGFISLALYRRNNRNWEAFAFCSLLLTFCAGLMALSFWSVRKDFDIRWWGVNLFLLIYPCFFLKSMFTLRGRS